MRLAGLTAAIIAALMLTAGSAGAATITPDTTNDDYADNAACSLREAVKVLSTDNTAVEDDCAPSGSFGPDDTVDLGPGTYQLSLGEDLSPDDGEQGDLDTAGTLRIEGDGLGATTIDGLGMATFSRLIDVRAGALTVDGLKLTHGDPALGGAAGGAISSVPGTSLEVANAEIVQNGASQGGGIYAAGSLDVDDTAIHGNEALSTSAGAGIYADGADLQLSGSTVQDNHAIASQSIGGGIYLALDGNAHPRIESSRVIDNTSQSIGAGIISGMSGDGELTIADSLIAANVAYNTSPSVSVIGGGVFVATDNLVVERSVVRDNTLDADAGMSSGGAYGGGIYLDAAGGPKALTLTDSIVDNNSAHTSTAAGGSAGGGVYGANATMVIRRSSITRNDLAGGSNDGAFQTGAGIFNGPSSGTLLLVNSTVADNEAPKANGIFGTGGIQLTDVNNAQPATSATIVNSTITGNESGDATTHGDALFLESSGGGVAQATIRGSYIQSAEASPCAGTGSFISGGYNVVNDSSCTPSPLASDEASAVLPGALDLGGTAVAGLTGAKEQFRLSLPPAGSTPVNLIPAADCLDEVSAPLATDQTGFHRPSPTGGNCDAGAVELNDDALTPPGGGPGQGAGPGTGTKCKKRKKPKKKRSATTAKKKKKKKCKKPKKKQRK